jgi:hypothetical protein
MSSVIFEAKGIRNGKKEIFCLAVFAIIVMGKT